MQTLFEQGVPLPSPLFLDTDIFFDNDTLKSKLTSIIKNAEPYKAVLEEYCRSIDGDEQRFDDEIRDLLTAY